jgi:hypothetical protein
MITVAVPTPMLIVSLQSNLIVTQSNTLVHVRKAPGARSGRNNRRPVTNGTRLQDKLLVPTPTRTLWLLVAVNIKLPSLVIVKTRLLLASNAPALKTQAQTSVPLLRTPSKINIPPLRTIVAKMAMIMSMTLRMKTPSP